MRIYGEMGGFSKNTREILRTRGRRRKVRKGGGMGIQ